MRLLFLSHQGDLGGATSAMVEGIEALVARGHRVAVWMPQAGSMIPALDRLGVAHEVIPFPSWVGTKGRGRWKTIWRNWRAIPVLAKRLERAKPDLVITNTMAVGVGAIAADGVNLKHVWWIHEFGAEDHGLEFAVGDKQAGRVMTRTTNRMIVNSDAVREKFKRFYPAERIERVYYRIDPAPATDAPDFAPAGAFHLALPGSLNPQKGQGDAIAALATLTAQGRDAHLHLFGEGASGYAERLRAQARAGGVAERVHFHGHVRDLGARLAKAGAVLVTSRCEAFGRVTVEALRAGAPVIATDAGGTRELIHDGATGLLYPPGDGDALAREIARLMDDPALAAKLGQAGRDWAASRFGAAEFADALEAALTRALG